MNLSQTTQHIEAHESLPETDAQLLRKMSEGDEAAFSSFFDRFNRVIYSFILRIVRSESEAEDVTQEVFWHIWTKSSEYCPHLGSPFSWSVTIARRKAIDRIRSNTRHARRVENAYNLGMIEETTADLGADNIDLQTAALAVRAALSTLPADQLNAIELSFFEGLSHTQIAQLLDVPIGTIKARIRRGMEKLRAPLEQIRFSAEVQRS